VHGLRDVAMVQVAAQVLVVAATVLGAVSIGSGDVWRAVALVAGIGASALLLPGGPRSDGAGSGDRSREPPTAP
jgi:hypothetical protein